MSISNWWVRSRRIIKWLIYINRKWLFLLHGLLFIRMMRRVKVRLNLIVQILRLFTLIILGKIYIIWKSWRKRPKMLKLALIFFLRFEYLSTILISIIIIFSINLLILCISRIILFKINLFWTKISKKLRKIRLILLAKWKLIRRYWMCRYIWGIASVD